MASNNIESSEEDVLDVSRYTLQDASTANVFEESELLDKSVLSLLDEPFSQLPDGKRLRPNGQYEGFDNNVGDSWIYPSNFPIRQYQFTITKAALFKNTLVVLPTGLGKTFIAAVVMYNIYRWYPTGKVIFMAPTRPLVNQQIEACYRIMGIPKEDTTEMTGKQQRKSRVSLWQQKRVFYVTPQVVLADIHSPEQGFPLDRVRLLVIDEAHRAKGRYAYTEVMKAISARNSQFRVLALSATPGRTLEDVTAVIQNLLISHIEVRWDNSIDVSPYTHKKNLKTLVIPLGQTLSNIRDEFVGIIDPYVRNLLENNVISGHVGSLSRGSLIMAQKRYRENCSIMRHPNHTSIHSDFSVCISLYHALELLVRHGIRSFLNFFDDENNVSAEKYFVSNDKRLKALLNRLRAHYGRCTFAAIGAIASNNDTDFGHPKFTILQQHLKDHFNSNPTSKVIVFCEFRDSVAMVHRVLQQNRPLIKPRCIVGQGGTTGIKAVSQKEQIAAMKEFRSGACNTLIATCVAEEGIDVGEVDLIICFDVTKNPSRFVQRIGRTGRKRIGHVLMLVTEGREHETLKEVLASKDKTNQKLTKSKEIIRVLYRKSARLVPPDFDPKCIETFIQIPTQEPEADSARKNVSRKIITKETNKSATKTAVMLPKGTQDVRNFFHRSIPAGMNLRQEDSSPHDKSKSLISVSYQDGQTAREFEVQKRVKSLVRHRDRILRQRHPKAPKLLTVLSLKDSIQSATCPDIVKSFLLEQDFNALKEIIEQSEILQVALEQEPLLDDDDVILLDDGDDGSLNLQIKNTEKIFGGTSKMKQHMKDLEEINEYYASVRLKNRIEYPPRFVATDEHITEFEEMLEHLLPYWQSLPVDLQTSAVSVTDTPEPSLCQTPSKCMPIETQNMGPDEAVDPLAEAPLESKVLEPTSLEPANKTLKTTPLMRAFNCSVQKQRNSDDGSPRDCNKRFVSIETRMTLEYFGLNSIEQLFEDSEGNNSDAKNLSIDVPKSMVEKGIARTPAVSPNMFDTVDMDLDGNISTSSDVREKQQCTHSNKSEGMEGQGYTISQVLRIISPQSVKSKSVIPEEEPSSSKQRQNANVNQYLVDFMCDDDDEDVVFCSQPDDVIDHVPTLKKQCKQLDLGNAHELFEDSDEKVFSDPTIINSCQTSQKENMQCFINCVPEGVQFSSPVPFGKEPETSPSILTKRPKLSRLMVKKKEVVHSVATTRSSPTRVSSAYFGNKKLTNPLSPAYWGTNQVILNNNSPAINDESAIGFAGKRRRVCSSTDSDVKSDHYSASKNSRIANASNDTAEQNLRSSLLGKQRRKKCRRELVRKFLETQAAASTTDDEQSECGAGDSFLASFIDFDVETTTSADRQVDIHAAYLQSVHNPARLRGFNIPAERHHVPLEDIYSQVPVSQSDDHEVYELDSFIVQGDVVETVDNSELSELEVAERMLKKQRKQKRRTKKRKRIVVQGPNTSDEMSSS